MISRLKAVDAAGFANMNAAAQASSKVFRDAAASTGMFEVQQLRLNSATDDYIKKLKAQKAGFREIIKSRRIAAAAYKEQLAMENMTVRQGVGSNRTNKGVYDVIVPKNVSAELDTAGKRLAFMNAELKSGAHQMVNWGKNTQWAGRQLMVGFTMPIAAFGAAAGVMAYQVDKELTRIAKVYDTTATTAIAREKELLQVRLDSMDTATQAAREYGNAVTDTLNVQAELAATGKTGAELQKSTLEVMRIARLGEVDNQTAIDSTIALQTVFSDTIKTSEDLSDAFNYMNAIENATSLSTKDFATAIPVAASAVKAFGGDVKELGILLTAMRENGIQASEGANALKATMQRLGRPSKQIREEWAALTGTDITKLVDGSDSLMEVFQNINAATRDLDPDAQRKAFAGLFGSYQVSKMMALTKGMENLANGTGQVTTAMEVAQSSTESWAATADREIKEYQKSISGQWDIAYQSMKAELVEIGKPFLELATSVVKAISWALKAFNDMPDFGKKMVAAGIATAALAGGVLMLAGLVGNLAGNLLKGITNLAAFALKMDIMTKEEKAAKLATEATTQAYLEQANAISMLNMQLEKLTAAQVESNAVMLQTNPAFAGMPPGQTAQQAIAARKQQLELEREMQAFRREDKNGREYFVAPVGSNYTNASGGRRGIISRQEAEAEANLVLHKRSLEMNKAEVKVQNEGVILAEKKNEADEKRFRMAAGFTALAAAEGALLATTMISSNEVVDDLAQAAMFAGLMAPAIASAAPLATGLAGRFKDAAIAAKDAGKSVVTTGKATIGGASGASRMAKAFNGAKLAALAIMGPMGWLLTATGAAALVVYKLYKNAQEEQQEMIDGQKVLAKSAKNFGEHMGYAAREMKTISDLALSGNNETVLDQFDKSIGYFTETETGKAEVKAFEGLGDAERQAAAMNMLIDYQQTFKMSSEDAATAVAALWSEATGDSPTEAVRLMQSYVDELGNVNSADMSKVWENLAKGQEDALNTDRFESFWSSDEDARNDAVDYAKESGALIGEAFATAVSSTSDPEKAAQNFQEFAKLATGQWQKEFELLQDDSFWRGSFKQMGITSGEEFAAAWSNPVDKAKLLEGAFEGDEIAMEKSVSRAREYEAAVVKAAAAQLELNENVDTVAELQKSALVSAKMMTPEMQKQAVLAAQYMANAPAATPEMAKAAEDTATATINAILFANGLEVGADYAEALARWIAFSKGEVYGAASGANALAGGMNRAKNAALGFRAAMKNAMTREQMAEAGQEAISGMQNEMADGWKDQLADQHDNQMDSLNDQWDNRMDQQSDRFDAEQDALASRQEAESRAFDAAWEAKRKGLENYWDARIEGVEKAIEVEEKAEEKRQKMFDAEIARINRLADVMNTGIDFNVALNEGNLDEAAKIANTAAAKDAEFIFNRERDAGADKSAARVDRLGNKQERLEDQKDAAMEGFDKREEAARAHFDKMQEMEQESLDKRQEMNRERLEKQAEAEKEALDRRHEREKENLDRILKTFLASTPTTKKALQKQVEELGAALNDFGIKTLDPMSQKWGNWFRNRMREGLTNSAAEAATADAWAKFGQDTKQAMLDAWGFKSEKEFHDFINGKKYSTDIDATPRGFGSQKTGPQNATKRVDETQHTGGMVGSGNDNRYGVAKNYKGQHPSEVLVNAQKGEYIVNKDAAKKFGPELDSINAGRGVGGKFGMAGRMGGVMVATVAKGLMKKGKENLKSVRAAQAAAGAAAGGSGGFNAAGYQPGVGGWQRPSVPGFGWRNTHDYGTPIGTPVYATSDGVIVSSRAITSGGSPGNGGLTPDGVPYRSYGEHIALRMADGNIMNFGHLSARYVGAGQQVTGGAMIGRTGNTGNSSGPHLHMDVGGNYNASGYLASRGIALRKGAEYVKFDNTMANLHRGESVLTKNLTSKMHEGVDKFAQGPLSQYNVTVNIDGYNGDKKALAREVINEIKREAARAPQSRSVGGNS